MERDELPWVRLFQRRCKARLKKGQDPEFHGRCELSAKDHEDYDHALERGMVWVRWNRRGIRYEQPSYD